MQNSIIANVAHIIDSTIMQMVTLELKNKGVVCTSLHDCILVHPGNIGLVKETIQWVYLTVFKDPPEVVLKKMIFDSNSSNLLDNCLCYFRKYQKSKGSKETILRPMTQFEASKLKDLNKGLLTGKYVKKVYHPKTEFTTNFDKFSVSVKGEYSLTRFKAEFLKAENI
jgi:hypothetical protein